MPEQNPLPSSPAFARRGMLTTAALSTAAVLGGARLARGEEDAAAAAAAIGDPEILNFALNLEYLEAEFYLRAATGRGLEAADVGGRGTPGGVTGGRRVEFQTRAFRNYAWEIAKDERAHVRFLRRALGSAAVARPAIDINQSFTKAARAAGLIGPGQTFDAYASERNFLLAAFLFEDVGVTAYKGAARLISNKDVLEAAAGILAAEAYHAAEIRTILYALGQYAPARAISDARDSLDGAGDKDQGIGSPDASNIFPSDSNGLAFSRSFAQVLGIVYLGGSASGFGFFPNRLNGAIR